jgi:hypothetical protein
VFLTPVEARPPPPPKDEVKALPGNTNVWTSMSADPELATSICRSAPTNDFYDRLGDNLYSEARSVSTPPPARRSGTPSPLRVGLRPPAALNRRHHRRREETPPWRRCKQGFSLVFDRRTGEPVWPIEERRCRPRRRPAKRRRQPWPRPPPPSTPASPRTTCRLHTEIRKLALDAVAPFDLGPIYTPPSPAIEGGKQGH